MLILRMLLLQLLPVPALCVIASLTPCTSISKAALKEQWRSKTPLLPLVTALATTLA